MAGMPVARAATRSLARMLATAAGGVARGKSPYPCSNHLGSLALKCREQPKRTRERGLLPRSRAWPRPGRMVTSASYCMTPHCPAVKSRPLKQLQGFLNH